MQNLKIASKLLILTSSLVVATTIAVFFLMRTATNEVYSERYDLMRTQVESAIAIMQHYADEEKDGKISHDEAVKLAFGVISVMHFDPNGYLFGYDYDGTRAFIYGDKGVGKNFIDLTDKNGTPLIKNLIDAGRKGGGWTEYFWPKPNMAEDQLFLKASYAKAFEPWSVVVGTGAYLDDIQAKVQKMVISAVMQGAAVFLAAIILAYLVMRSITKPLKQIHDSLEAVAAEDTDIQVPYTNLTNEIGMMATATRALQDKVRQRHEMERRAREQQAALDGERDANIRLKEEEATTQSHVVSVISDALRQLAVGDLTVRCADLGSRYSELRSNFNDALIKLEAAMRRVDTKSTDIDASKDEIVRATGELAIRTERQAANLEEASAAIEELSVTVRQASDGAKRAASKVATINEEATKSDGIVVKAIDAMSGIERSSSEITKIIGVIDEIAFQTNLLALNAGVEAARAGESGKGFAVVAQEVRELAQRSSAAAKEIKDQISRSSSQVAEGVNLVGMAGKALRCISEQIQDANGIVANIAQSAQEQNATLAGIAGSVNQLDIATQQNAAMAEETTATANILASDTDELAKLIRTFRVGEGAAVRTQVPRRNVA